jgi:hypothetical protein
MDFLTRKDKNIQLHSRVELRWEKHNLSFSKKTALSFFQQIEWNIVNCRIIFRWTTFNIPTYDLRIYEYENDLPGNFRSVLLNGRGYKYFLLVRWSRFPQLNVDVKYGQRLYPDQNTISSGLNEISGNRVHDVRLSVTVKF